MQVFTTIKNKIRQLVNFMIVTVICPGVEARLEDLLYYFTGISRYMRHIRDLLDGR
ncbi:hypothetical protein [Sediminibacterium ginsengisoli]|uniref:hypothetical protein n=1 Tax=Sediminibacterium ginsengisoli TaxID=413434 RepID=UPI001590770D|nr:hypothetical protein [Sediminibacterium ginsengisoli]